MAVVVSMTWISYTAFDVLRNLFDEPIWLSAANVSNLHYTHYVLRIQQLAVKSLPESLRNRKSSSHVLASKTVRKEVIAGRLHKKSQTS